ncbi:hypothetical protein A2U01_0116700, partial [Trifolium medium]|nr:hypothetical protein [Trifolium medium]
LPEPQTIHVSSSSSPDTAELDEEADMLKKGVAKYGETPNPEQNNLKFNQSQNNNNNLKLNQSQNNNN